MTIVRLDLDRLNDARELLASNNLPIDDLGPKVMLYGAQLGDRLVGVVGLERHGPVGLMRSLAVDQNHRGSGLGARLVEVLEDAALGLGVHSLFLLTTTAEAFFARHGYGRLPRESAPTEIRQTEEFSNLCPASSAFMGKRLG